MHVGRVQHQLIPFVGGHGGQQVLSARVAGFQGFPLAFEQRLGHAIEQFIHDLAAICRLVAQQHHVAARVECHHCGAGRAGRDRGDVPGWVLITLMTAGIVTVQGGDFDRRRAEGKLDNLKRELDADPEVEVIIVARGGGDFQNLLVFSDEKLVRAASACTTPLVSAIGHEADRPLLDEVADLRASTPTDAAKRVVPGHGTVSSTWPAAMAPQGRYLRTLQVEVRAAVRAGHSIQQAVGEVGASERGQWQLFEAFHPRNVTVAFTEAEWEN